MSSLIKRGALYPLFLLISLTAPLFGKIDIVLVNDDGMMFDKEVEKIEQMGQELYEKTKVAVFVAAVGELNTTKPLDLLGPIEKNYKDYILLYFSKKPTAVNIFGSENALKLIDKEQILSPFPWRGTIKPLMSPAFSKNDDIKIAAAIFNGYADIVDQIAESKSIELESSVGSGSKDSFKVIRWIFYSILFYFIAHYIYIKIRRRREQSQ